MGRWAAYGYAGRFQTRGKVSILVAQMSHYLEVYYGMCACIGVGGQPYYRGSLWVRGVNRDPWPHVA